MKHLLTFIIVTSCFTYAIGQEGMEKVMEKRAREMHRVLGLDDAAQWRRFIQENYTQRLIDKPMRAEVQGGDNGPGGSSQGKPSDNLEAKVKMFGRLHDDFGGAKIASIKSAGEELTMVLESGDGLVGTFQLKFDKSKPYLIDGMGIQARR